MKKTIIYIIISLCWFSVSSMKSGFGSRAEKDIVLHPTNHPHTEVNPPADMPDVYYNSELGVITIVDYASVTYYVTIYDDWWNVVITDTKPGGGTIDVSSLSSGDYVIEISTSWNHDYEGQFTGRL